MKFIIIVSILFLAFTFVKAQKIDTTKPKIITIAGAFKPKLKIFEKINFATQPLILDSTKPNLKYNVPTQNLFFVYTPVPLKPLALQVNPLSTLQNGAYVKVGYGNLQAPFLKAGATLGDGKYSIFNAYAGYQGIKGSRNLQQASNAYLGINATLTTVKNIEAFGGLQLNLNNANRFGFDSSRYRYTKTQVENKVTNFTSLFGIKNANPTEWGINYNPTFAINYAANNFKNNEIRGILNVPLEKNFGNKLSFKVTAHADVARVKTKLNTGMANNLVYVLPEFIFKYKAVFVQAGAMPAWDNKTFFITPNILAEARFGKNKFLFTAGWVTKYNKGGLQNWWNNNMFINDSINVFNTQNQEIFGGLKGTSGNHLTYTAKVGFTTIKNAPLFTNNSFDAKTFFVLKETQMQRLQIHGEVAYTVNERFNFDASAEINQFLNLKTFTNAFGMLPLIVHANMHLNLTKAININAGLLFFDGAKFINKLNVINKVNAGADVNLGLAVKVNPRFNIWVQGSNLLNSSYTRWANYNAAGLQIQGGIIFNTNFKNKLNK